MIKRARKTGTTPRRGMSTIQAVMALAVTFPMAWVLYLIAQKSLGNLYQIISSMVGWPYL